MRENMREKPWRKRHTERKLDPDLPLRFTAEMLERGLKSGRIKYPPLEYQIFDPTRDHTKENEVENKEEKVLRKK